MTRASPWHRWLARVASLATEVRAAVERTAFWLAIALVAGYPGVLLADSVAGVPATALLALLGGHLLTIVLGHRYDPGGDERRRDAAIDEAVTDDVASDDGATDGRSLTSRAPADD